MILYLIKSTFLLLVFFSIYRFSLQDKKSLHFNRFYLLISMVLGMILPLLNFSFFVESNPIIKTKKVVIKQIEGFSDIEYFPTIQKESLLSNIEILFIGIVILLSIRFAFRIYLIIRLKKTGQQIKHEYGKLVLHSKIKSPFSFLKSIYLNLESWNSGLIEKEILIHEQGHVVQKHSLDILIIEFLKIGFWFQPMLYLYKKAIQENHEFLADAYCLKQTININTYQNIILNYYSEQSKRLELSSSFNYKNLKKRFMMMKNTKKGNVSKVVFYTSAFVFTYFGLIGIEGKAKGIEKIETTFSSNMNHLIDEEILQNTANTDKVINSSKIENGAAKPKVGLEVFLNDIQGKINAYYGNQVLDKTLHVFFKIDVEGNIFNVIIDNTDDIEIKKYITKILIDSPKWHPEIKNGVEIESSTMIPLRVKLEDTSTILAQVPVETKASPKEGIEAFYKKFITSVKTPEFEENTEIKLVVKMVVDTDGSLTNFETVNKNISNKEFEEHIFETLRSMPNWNPATEEGKAISTVFYLPISIKIKIKI